MPKHKQPKKTQYIHTAMKDQNNNPESSIVSPIAIVAQCTGLSPKSIYRKLPLTRISLDQQGVLLSNLIEFLIKNNRPSKDPSDIRKRIQVTLGNLSIPPVKQEKWDRRVLTPDEFLKLAAAVQPRFRASIVLQALCGFRPKEVAPLVFKGMHRNEKRGISHEDFDWEHNAIRVPAYLAKTRYSRIVPILPGVTEWLEWAGVRPGQTGPVCGNMGIAGETTRLGHAVFKARWSENTMRLSYIYYRYAVIRSLDQVAVEIGSSVAMLMKNIPRPREEGEAWFNMRPSDIP